MRSPVQSWSHSCWTFWSKQNTGISPLQIFLAQPSYRCTTILQVLCHLYAVQATMSQALQISQTTSHPWMTMEFHFYGLHRETSVILQVWHYLSHSQLAHQAGDLYPCSRHHHVRGLNTSVRSSCVLQTRHSFLCHLRQRLGVCVKLLPIFRHCSRHAASLHFRLPPWRWWTNWMHESDTRAIPPCIL